MTHLSLCSGIGGLDLAAEWAGFETVAQCEIDAYASKVLAKNFPGVPNLHDIRTVTNERLAELGIRTPTVISAGFPCQPYSLAGKGLGDRDDRDLWGEVARVVGEIHPLWFVGENTPGLFARSNQRYFRRVLDDLVALGYTVGWGIWGACDVGAPHKRDRVFILAYANGEGRRADEAAEQRACEPLDQKGRGNESCGADRISGDVPDADRTGQQERRGQRVAPIQLAQVRRAIPYAAGDKLGLHGSAGEIEKAGRCGNYIGQGTQINASREWWEAEPDVGRVANGVSARVDRLRCLGNAVVPQQAYPIFKAIAEFEEGKYD